MLTQLLVGLGFLLSANATTTPDLIAAKPFEYLISQYDWDTKLAYQIMMCESGANSNIINNNPGTGDYSVGLFQINLHGDNARLRPSEDWLKIPANNVAYAYKLYQNGGWGHWRNCYKIVTGDRSN